MCSEQIQVTITFVQDISNNNYGPLKNETVVTFRHLDYFYNDRAFIIIWWAQFNLS